MMYRLKCNKCGSTSLIGFDDGSAAQCGACGGVINDEDIDGLYEIQVKNEITSTEKSMERLRNKIKEDMKKLQDDKKDLETQLKEKPWKRW